jgi:1,4-dihydroxy-2-naphthoate octaprenyltransferase
MKIYLEPWLMAIRPKTMLASIGPVLIGLSLAYDRLGEIHYIVALLTLLCAVLLQFSTNIANDYLDFVKGVDTVDRIGPVRVTNAGLIKPLSMKRALICLLTLAFVLGLYLMYVGGPLIVIFGLTSLYFAYGYTGGPYPLSYLGLGEVSALIFFGFIAVVGTTFLQTHQIDYQAIWLGLGVGAISFALLGVNNLRDIHTDTKTNKRTLAVRLGENNHRLTIFASIVVSFIVALIYAIISKHYLALGACAVTILFKKNWSEILNSPISEKLNNNLATTAKYLFIYSLIISISTIIRF